jgi:hypothetical protein
VGYAVYSICSFAAVLSLIGGFRIARRREPLWQLLTGTQVGVAAMMILLVASRALHSPPLDLVDIAYALAFIAYLLYVRSRSTASR